MHSSVVKAKLRQSESALFRCLVFGGSALYEVAGLTGFDARWTILDHSS